MMKQIAAAAMLPLLFSCQGSSKGVTAVPEKDGPGSLYISAIQPDAAGAPEPEDRHHQGYSDELQRLADVVSNSLPVNRLSPYSHPIENMDLTYFRPRCYIQRLQLWLRRGGGCGRKPGLTGKSSRQPSVWRIRCSRTKRRKLARDYTWRTRVNSNRRNAAPAAGKSCPRRWPSACMSVRIAASRCHATKTVRWWSSSTRTRLERAWRRDQNLCPGNGARQSL